MSKNKAIAEFYNEHCADEECRLTSQSTEYLVTKILIANIIKQHSKILDLGGGTGVYAIPLCCDGNDVTLVDLSKNELEIASQKADSLGCPIKIVEGDASTYNDGVLYDAVLCLGPLYHCSSMNDVEQIIHNVLNCLRNGGYAFFSFVSKYAKFNRFVNEINSYERHKIPKINEILKSRTQDESTFIFESRGKLPISLVEPLSLSQFFESFDVDIIETLSIDLCNKIEDFNNDIFDILCGLGKGCMINNGEHVISIVQKKSYAGD